MHHSPICGMVAPSYYFVNGVTRLNKTGIILLVACYTFLLPTCARWLRPRPAHFNVFWGGGREVLVSKQADIALAFGSVRGGGEAAYAAAVVVEAPCGISIAARQ